MLADHLPSLSLSFLYIPRISLLFTSANTLIMSQDGVYLIPVRNTGRDCHFKETVCLGNYTKRQQRSGQTETHARDYGEDQPEGTLISHSLGSFIRSSLANIDLVKRRSRLPAAWLLISNRTTSKQIHSFLSPTPSCSETRKSWHEAR